MLVLTRKKNQEIVVGENIVVMVVDIQGNTVRLGIDAPKDVTVHRREVYEKIKQDSPTLHQQDFEFCRLSRL